MNSNHLQIATPLRERVTLEWRMGKLADQDDLGPMVMEINTVYRKIPVYTMGMGALCVKYTLTDFELVVGSEEDLNRLFFGKDYGALQLIKEKDAFYYGFPLGSSLIAQQLASGDYHILDGFVKKLFQPPVLNLPPMQYQAVQFDDGAVLFYLERSPGVYQGTWFENLDSFLFFFHGDYVG